MKTYYAISVSGQPIVYADYLSILILLDNLSGLNYQDVERSPVVPFERFRANLSRELDVPLPVGTPIAMLNIRTMRAMKQSTVGQYKPPATHTPNDTPTFKHGGKP